MRRIINQFLKNEKRIGEVLAGITLVLLIVVVNAPATFAAFWRTVAGQGAYSTGLSNATSFLYGYGYNGTRFGYGYGYGYGVNDALGYLDEPAGAQAYLTTAPAVTSVIALFADANITGTAAAATAVTTTQARPLIATVTEGTITVLIPSGTVITKSDGTAFNSTAITAAASTLTGIQLGVNNSSKGMILFGISGVDLRFSKPVQITLPVSADPGALLTLGVLHAGNTTISTAGLTTSSSATCAAGVPSPTGSTATVASGAVVFYTCRASTFTAYTTSSGTTPPPAASTGGGGGGGGAHCRDDKGRYITGDADKDGKCKVKKTEAVTTPAVETFKPGEKAPVFRDIANHWAKDFVEQLRVAGIIHGKTVGYFQPNAALTRAELVKIALNAFGDSVATSVSTKPFSDAEPAMWYSPYLAKAKELGIVQGYADGSFHPNQTVNRAEALKILLAASGLSVPASSGSSFSDVSKAAWYAKYVEFAKASGIVSGYANGKFGGGNPVLRGEMAKMAVLTMKLKK